MKKTIKKIIASLLVSIMALTLSPLNDIVGQKINLDWLSFGWRDFTPKASALSSYGSCGENVNYSYDGKTDIITISGSGPITDYSTTVISPFANYKGTVSCIIENGVTSIGNYAFNNCSGLTSVVIPDSVTSIGENAFLNCKGLTNIVIPDSVTSIADDAFRGCTALSSVTIGNNVINIGAYAFYNCTALSSVTIGNNVINIGAYAFCNCKGLTSITIPNSVINIEEWTFENCANLINVTLSNNITSINDCVFWNCTSLKSIMIPNSVTSIGEYAFNRCICLTSVIIPNSVTSIGDSAFQRCTDLSSITIPDSIISIGDYAFSECINLTSIIIPENVNSIGDNAFFDCEGITSIIVDSNNRIYDSRKNSNAVIETETNTLKKGCDNTIIPNSVVNIDSFAFYRCTGLKEIVIPDGVTTIGESAFSGCINLEEIAIPDSVTTIGDSAFLACTGLTEITFPNGIINISNSVLSGCTNVENIRIPNSVTSIGDSAFSGCIGITRITIPNSVINIGISAFNNCINLKELTIPCSAEMNYRYNFDDDYYGSFKNCKNLEKIIITKGNGIMCDYEQSLSSSYYECTPWYESREKINEIIIEDGVTNVSNNAFLFCKGLTSVSISDSVTNIGNSAFYGCTGLTSIIIGNNVTNISDEAFYGCKGLTSITIPSSVTKIENNALRNCSNLQNIIFESDDYIEMGNTVFDETYNAVICCRENSYMHYYCERKGLQYCILDDENNPNFSVENDILVSYNGSAESVFVSSASKIGFGAFNGNETVKSIELASNVTRIYNQAFKNCVNLEKIIIPKNVSSIGDNAFAGCDSLTVWCYVGSYAEAFAVNHDIPVQYITLELSDSVITLADSETASLTASFSTAMLDENKLIWTSSDPSVVSVNDGAVTVLDVGEAEIIATTSSGLSASCTIVVDLKLNNDTEAEIDTENGIVTGVDFVNKDIDGIKNLFANSNIAVTSSNGKVGTGDTVTLCRANGEEYRTVSVVIFGDVNGDGWYDGMDAMIVSCLANGLLSESDVGETIYIAADCNHDGVIDSLDVDLLQQAGVLLADVDQTKSEEELIETSSAYVEYLNLIDQTVETETTEAIEEEPTATEIEPARPEPLIFRIVNAIALVFWSVVNFFINLFD